MPHWTEVDLHDACRSGDLETVKQCIEQKKIYLETVFCDWTPFFTACYYNRVEIVRELMNHPVVNIARNVPVFYNWTPLHAACYQGHAAIVEELLRFKLDINEQDSRGRTPLYLACCQNFVNVLRQLIQRGGDTELVDLAGKTPFYVACEEGHVDIMRELLDRNVSIHRPAKDGCIPFFAACRWDRFAIVRELLPVISIKEVKFCLNRRISPEMRVVLLSKLQKEHWKLMRWLILGQTQPLSPLSLLSRPVLETINISLKEALFSK